MNNIMEINMMLGGVKPKSIPNDSYWCGVDGGAEYLVDKGIELLVSCGDFDSVSKEKEEIIKNSSNYWYKKNNEIETDADYALRKITELFKNLKTVNIYGATGKRLDHFFGNILLLNNDKYPNLQIRIIDDNNTIELAKKGENVFSSKEGYKYFSVVPIYEKTVMTIKNAKYEAENLELTMTRPNATSNEFYLNKDIILSLNKNCLVIYSKD